MDEPRAKTSEEIREEFLLSVKDSVSLWGNCEGKSDLEKCEGVAFSILALIDGVGMMPALKLVVDPHPDDKEFLQKEGENWYEPGTVINDCSLHDEFCQEEE